MMMMNYVSYRFRWLIEVINCLVNCYYSSDHGNNDMLIYKAIDYYGLVHSRYIFSPSGFDEVKAKYLKGDYGTCPRHYCNGQNCLPFGK